MKRRILSLAALALTVSLVSCDEELGLGGEGSIEQKLAEQFLSAEQVGIDAYNILDAVRRDTNFSPNDSVIFDGANVTTSESGGITTIAVNYGTGVVGADGKTRKGVIIGLESGDYTQANGVMEIGFGDYSVDDVSVFGTVSATNTGNDEFDLNFLSLKLNEEFELNSAQNLKWTSGFSTFSDASDDKYELSGGINGTEIGTANAIDITIAATDALNYNRACEFGMESGIASLAFRGDSIAFSGGSIDFIAGDGVANDGCNNNVNLTVTSDDGATLNFIKQFDGF